MKNTLPLRWTSGGLYLLETTVVGTVIHGLHGWEAYGCEVEWQDVDLGVHGSEKKAKASVQKWVKRWL